MLNVGGIAIVNGQVLKVDGATTMTFDRNNIIRRNATVVLTETSTDGLPALVPVTAGDLLAPFGNVFVLAYVIKYSNGDTEPINVLTGDAETVKVSDPGSDLAITLNVYDRARAYQRAGFQDTVVVPPFTAIEGAIMQILTSIQVGFTPIYNFMATGFATGSSPSVYDIGDDPWQAVTDLATSAGCEIFHDPNGTCLLIPTPNPLTQPISWYYDEGKNLATDLERTLTRAGVGNYVVRDGEGTGVVPPVRGIWMDTSPLSRTYIGGTFGVQVDYATSPLINTQPMAQNAAQAAGYVNMGSIESIDLTSIPKPDHDCDDVIGVARVRAGVPAGTLYVLDSGTLGFGNQGLLDTQGRAIADMVGPLAG